MSTELLDLMFTFYAHLKHLIVRAGLRKIKSLRLREEVY